MVQYRIYTYYWNKITGAILTYESYFKLLYYAAISYNEQFAFKRTMHRSAFIHNIVEPYAELIMTTYGSTCNMDTQVDTVLQTLPVIQHLEPIFQLHSGMNSLLLKLKTYSMLVPT